MFPSDEDFFKSVLVTGGAGYIGSHTIHELLKQGYHPVVVDNLSNGFKESVPDNVEFYQLDVRNKAEMKSVFMKHNFSAVVHLAGLAIVEESFAKAEDYFAHNVSGTLTVLELCREQGVKRFIFSSSSTIYGDASGTEKLSEAHPVSPMSPYGKSKMFCEEKIKEFAAEIELSFMNFRYFNVAGASTDLTNGSRGKGSQRIIFNAAKAAVHGGSFVINGNEYPTADGTCVRDYIHVEDIADIHVLALKHLQTNKCQKTLNCGYGTGFSVQNIVDSFKKNNNVDFKIEMGPRRSGDPAYLVGDCRELTQLLKWKSRFENPLEAICRSAYLWEKKST